MTDIRHVETLTLAKAVRDGHITDEKRSLKIINDLLDAILERISEPKCDGDKKQ